MFYNVKCNDQNPHYNTTFKRASSDTNKLNFLNKFIAQSLTKENEDFSQHVQDFAYEGLAKVVSAVALDLAKQHVP